MIVFTTLQEWTNRMTHSEFDMLILSEAISLFCMCLPRFHPVSHDWRELGNFVKYKWKSSSKRGVRHCIIGENKRSAILEPWKRVISRVKIGNRWRESKCEVLKCLRAWFLRLYDKITIRMSGLSFVLYFLIGDSSSADFRSVS